MAILDVDSSVSPCCAPNLGRPQSPSLQELLSARASDRSWTKRAVEVPGGESHIGIDRAVIPQDGEAPRRPTQLSPFRMDPYCVTNRWFAEFVAATDYITEAERFGWSLVFWNFTDPEGSYQRVAAAPWWCKVKGADWCHPFGPHSGFHGLEDHPVVHISWNDAMAFAAWAGGRLASEAEWEHAARGALADAKYPWGHKEPTDDAPLCNIWQGPFPHEDTGRDGYRGTAPVDAFDANHFGLHQMSGNVWEWCFDRFHRRPSTNGLQADESTDGGTLRLLKGGSFLCHKSYCYRYRIAARTGATAESSTSHMGFRLVVT